MDAQARGSRLPRSGQWSVSTRSIGEVLTTDIRSDRLRLLVFSNASPGAALEIEKHLQGLSAAVESRDPSGSGSLPSPLRQATLALLGLVEELEQQSGCRAGAVAFHSAPEAIGCACVAGGEPDVWSRGRRSDVPWVMVRPTAGDDGEAPARARAFSLPQASGQNVRLQWPFLIGASRPEGVVVDATWEGNAGLAITVRALGGSAGTREDAPSDPATQSAAAPKTEAAPAGEDRGNFFSGWFADLEKGEPQAAPVPSELPGIDSASPSTVAPVIEAAADGPETAPADSPAPTPPARIRNGSSDLSTLVEELRAAAERQFGPSAREVSSSAGVDDASTPAAAAEISQPATEGAPGSIPESATTAPRTEAPSAVDRDAWLPEIATAPSVDTSASSDATLPADLPHVPTVAPSLDADIEAAEADFVTVAANGDGVTAPPSTARRPEWPEFVPAPRRSGAWVTRGMWAAMLTVLFAMGWWLGRRGEEAGHASNIAPVAVRMLRSVGLAGARYTVTVTSEPSGADIAIDERPSPFRTPADLELTPGLHRLTLSLPENGHWSTIVKGDRGDDLKVEAALGGSLQVLAPEALTPIAVTVDGDPRGFAPIRMTGVPPGPHDLEFSAAGQPPWSQTVRVPIRGEVTVSAKPFELPATGKIDVRSTDTDDEGTRDVTGATVWIDGERAGTTPLSLELPRGPHSIRAVFHGETSGIQLIDLPGGNQRYATFTFGTSQDAPRIALHSPTGPIAPGSSPIVVAAIDEMTPREVREMWLHVTAPDGTWKRYEMLVEADRAGLTGTVAFPGGSFDASGDARYYVSALTTTGEEYFTDIAHARPQKPKPRRHSIVIKPAAAIEHAPSTESAAHENGSSSDPKESESPHAPELPVPAPDAPPGTP